MYTKIAAFLVLTIAAFLSSCVPPGSPAPSGAANSPSKAFFSVPPALLADQRTLTGARTLTSDGWVTSSVGLFYEYVRGQVRFGEDVASGVKALLVALENVTYGSGYLLDSTVDATINDAAGTLRW